MEKDPRNDDQSENNLAFEKKMQKLKLICVAVAGLLSALVLWLVGL